MIKSSEIQHIIYLKCIFSYYSLIKDNKLNIESNLVKLPLFIYLFIYLFVCKGSMSNNIYIHNGITFHNKIFRHINE